MCVASPRAQARVAIRPTPIRRSSHLATGTSSREREANQSVNANTPRGAGARTPVRPDGTSGIMTALDVLVLDNPDSLHAQLVLTALANHGLTGHRVNSADLREASFTTDADGLRLRLPEGPWEVAPTTTVWYRRLGSPDVKDLDLDEAGLVRDELPHILLGGLAACGVQWVDEPFDVERAERKLYQTAVAARLNLTIPRWVVTNDPAVASGMLKEMRLVGKALSPGCGIAPFVAEVERDDLTEFAGLPVLLQELVATAGADLRVVVIGARAWTWRRPRTPDAVDWRAGDPVGAEFTYVSPHAVESDAVDLTRALSLTMSVQDWLETPDGVVFLEANPQGAWAFLERSEQLVPDALAVHLGQQSADSLDQGKWPKPLSRILFDFLPAGKAPENDGAEEPDYPAPRWASIAARSPVALAVARRANDEAMAAARTAEEKAGRLVRTALAALAIAIALLGFQLRFAIERDAGWFALPCVGAIARAFLVVAAFEASEIDRVGFYRHPSGRDLAEPGARAPTVRAIEQEDVGRRLAEWSSRHKHSALMQARAWFTRGLVLLVATAITTAAVWAITTTDKANIEPPVEAPPVAT